MGEWGRRERWGRKKWEEKRRRRRSERGRWWREEGRGREEERRVKSGGWDEGRQGEEGSEKRARYNLLIGSLRNIQLNFNKQRSSCLNCPIIHHDYSMCTANIHNHNKTKPIVSLILRPLSKLSTTRGFSTQILSYANASQMHQYLTHIQNAYEPCTYRSLVIQHFECDNAIK